MHHISKAAGQARDPLHGSKNLRKRHLYWIGFLEGVLASHRIEPGEEEALLKEAESFVTFFDDPDAADLIEDLKAKCYTGQNDLMTGLERIIDEKRSSLVKTEPMSPRDELNEFLGFCGGIVCDGIVLQTEAEAMLARFHESDVLPETLEFRGLWRALEAALADHILTPPESEELREWIALLVGDGFADTGVPNIGNVAQLDLPVTNPDDIEFPDKSFVLTGPMKMGTRSFIISEIKRCGGKASASPPTRNTDYVVVAATASDAWLTTHYGTKIKRAKELISDGYQLRFVSERALERAIGAAQAAQDPIRRYSRSRSNYKGLTRVPEGNFRFIALDVETANGDYASICQIGIACVDQNNQIHSWSSYVDPKTRFSHFNTRIHGIGPHHVAGAPGFAEVMEVIGPLLSRHIIFEHSSFDETALRRAYAAANLPMPRLTWADSLPLAKHVWPDLRKHSLDVLKDHLALEFRHHDAGEDAKASALVVLSAEKQTGKLFRDLMQETAEA